MTQNNSDTPDLFFGGPNDGDPVLVNGIPLKDLEVRPSKILTGWDVENYYVWNEATQRYEWQENP